MSEAELSKGIHFAEAEEDLINNNVEAIYKFFVLGDKTIDIQSILSLEGESKEIRMFLLSLSVKEEMRKIGFNKPYLDLQFDIVQKLKETKNDKKYEIYYDELNKIRKYKLDADRLDKETDVHLKRYPHTKDYDVIKTRREMANDGRRHFTQSMDIRKKQAPERVPEIFLLEGELKQNFEKRRLVIDSLLFQAQKLSIEQGEALELITHIIDGIPTFITGKTFENIFKGDEEGVKAVVRKKYDYIGKGGKKIDEKGRTAYESMKSKTKEQLESMNYELPGFNCISIISGESVIDSLPDLADYEKGLLLMSIMTSGIFAFRNTVKGILKVAVSEALKNGIFCKVEQECIYDLSQSFSFCIDDLISIINECQREAKTADSRKKAEMLQKVATADGLDDAEKAKIIEIIKEYNKRINDNIPFDLLRPKTTNVFMSDEDFYKGNVIDVVLEDGVFSPQEYESIRTYCTEKGWDTEYEKKINEHAFMQKLWNLSTQGLFKQEDVDRLKAIYYRQSPIHPMIKKIVLIENGSPILRKIKALNEFADFVFQSKDEIKRLTEACYKYNCAEFYKNDGKIDATERFYLTMFMLNSGISPTRVKELEKEYLTEMEELKKLGNEGVNN